MSATCETCRWWALSVESYDEPANQCHRYAPRPTVWEQGRMFPGWAEWPQTLPDDWCGEHQPKEPTP